MFAEGRAHRRNGLFDDAREAQCVCVCVCVRDINFLASIHMGSTGGEGVDSAVGGGGVTRDVGRDDNKARGRLWLWFGAWRK